MKYIIYQDSKNNDKLIYDEEEDSIYWNNTNDNLVNLHIKALSKFIYNIKNNNIKLKANDIEILKINSSSEIKFDMMRGILIVDNNIIGHIDENIKQTSIFSQKGGLVVIRKFKNNRDIIKIYIDYENNIVERKNDLVNKNNIVEDNGYIVANIKIPKSDISCNNSQDIKRILDGNFKIYKSIQELALKLDYINNISNIKENENKISELEEKIQSLIQDRYNLKKEIENSQLVAYNKLKQQLKTIEILIDRNIDLDEYTSSKDDTLEMIEKILKNSNFTNRKIENLLKKDVTVKIIQEYTDKIDMKVESLQGIKSELKELKLIGKEGL